MTYLLRYMTDADLPQVITIERAVFSMPWPESSYRYEIAESPYSHMVALEDTEAHPPSSRLQKFTQRIRREHPSVTGKIIAFGGLWKIVDEAHISTIATHPAHQGQGFGELALVGMLRRAVILGAGYVVLEVRVGNIVAQNLYHKYQFVIVARKKNYYQDDHEDGYAMRLDLTPETTAIIQERYTAVQGRHPFTDQYTQTPPPERK